METLYWKDGAVHILDQTLLPGRVTYVVCRDYREVAEAIKSMRVRGAPAIGAAAAYGLAVAAQGAPGAGREEVLEAVESAAATLLATRPTAVNLRWAVKRVLARLREAEGDGDLLKRTALAEAERIHAEDVAANKRLGRFGQELVPPGARILTHCNAGALATAGYGTALGVIRAAHTAGKVARVYADETRPFLQGARLTAWELQQDGIPVTVITDNMAGYLMARGLVDLVIVGADRIAANGDVANKIGTYSLAVLAQAHALPFYVAAPLSTLDMQLACGEEIPIEERPAEEVTHCGGLRIVPEGIEVWNPAFDVTPARLVTAIITDAGVAYPPYTESLRRICCDGGA
ncbi:MAG: S-methyl-5-thioribose-1-phosphate isomerase [Bacillota bacterium]